MQISLKKHEFDLLLDCVEKKITECDFSKKHNVYCSECILLRDCVYTNLLNKFARIMYKGAIDEIYKK